MPSSVIQGLLCGGQSVADKRGHIGTFLPCALVHKPGNEYLECHVKGRRDDGGHRARQAVESAHKLASSVATTTQRGRRNIARKQSPPRLAHAHAQRRHNTQAGDDNASRCHWQKEKKFFYYS